MITRSKLILFSLLAFILVLSSCYETEEYPIEPHIEYISFNFYLDLTSGDEMGAFKISFTDGDGDIGLEDSDTLAPYDTESKYYYNFFIDFFVMENGVYQPYVFPDTNFTYNSRIPIINDPDSDPKPIRGEIDLEMNVGIMKSVFAGDTVMMKAYIADRALHESNVVSTPDFLF